MAQQVPVMGTWIIRKLVVDKLDAEQGAGQFGVAITSLSPVPRRCIWWLNRNPYCMSAGISAWSPPPVQTMNVTLVRHADNATISRC